MFSLEKSQRGAVFSWASGGRMFETSANRCCDSECLESWSDYGQMLLGSTLNADECPVICTALYHFPGRVPVRRPSWWYMTSVMCTVPLQDLSIPPSACLRKRHPCPVGGISLPVALILDALLSLFEYFNAVSAHSSSSKLLISV